MAYVSGLLFAGLAAWFVWAAARHKAASLAEEARIKAEYPNAKPHELHPSLSILADFAPGLTIFSLAILAGGMVLAFLAVGPSRWFNWADLAGLLAAVAGYGHWMVTKTKYRSVESLREKLAQA